MQGEGILHRQNRKWSNTISNHMPCAWGSTTHSGGDLLLNNNRRPHPCVGLQVSAAVSVPAVAMRREDPLLAGPMGGRGGSGRADMGNDGETESGEDREMEYESEPEMPAG